MEDVEQYGLHQFTYISTSLLPLPSIAVQHATEYMETEIIIRFCRLGSHSVTKKATIKEKRKNLANTRELLGLIYALHLPSVEQPHNL